MLYYILFAFLLFFQQIHPESLNFSCDSIKKEVISKLPKKWQKTADKYFWPGVGVCATVIAVGLFWLARDRREPREKFTDFLYQLRANEPPKNGRLVSGDCSVEMIVMGDYDWQHELQVNSAMVHLGFRGEKLCSCMLDVPFASLDNPSVPDIVNVAMDRLSTNGASN